MSRDYKLDEQTLTQQELSLDSVFLEAAELVLSGSTRDDAIKTVRDNYYNRQEALSKNEYVEENGEVSFLDSELNYKTVDKPAAQIATIASELKMIHGNILE